MRPVQTIESEQPEMIVIWLHGLGASSQDFMDFIPELNLPPNLPIRFVFPNAPMLAVSINRGMVMPAWYDILSLQANGPEDEAGILKAEAWLAQLIQNECKTSGLDAERIVLAGFSQGGALALFTALRYPKKLGGVLALSTYLPLRDHLVKSLSPANRDCKIFMAHGEYDDVVAIDYARQSRDCLTDNHYAVNWQTYPMAHSVCAEEATDIKEFILLNHVFA